MDIKIPHYQIGVKVPMINKGIKAIKYFSDNNICKLHAAFFSGTGFAAKAGASYVSPFLEDWVIFLHMD